MELGERAISINADVPYPYPVPEMEFKTWMAIPLPVTGLERTEELYRLCFEAEAMLIHFLCSGWTNLKPYWDFLEMVKEEME
jgi:hypothetical protein